MGNFDPLDNSDTQEAALCISLCIERRTGEDGQKTYYLQSAVVFLILSIVFMIIGISVVFQDSRINLLEIPFLVGVVIYAIISTIRIQTKR